MKNARTRVPTYIAPTAMPFGMFLIFIQLYTRSVGETRVASQVAKAMRRKTDEYQIWKKGMRIAAMVLPHAMFSPN
jgi:hypothetical protein